MIDLTTTYLGLKLRSPLVPSSSPLMEKVHHLKHMEDAGAGAVVLHSLFEEQITHESHELDHYLNRGAESYAEASSYFPDLIGYNRGPEGYLDHIRRAKEALSIPVIASLNGVSTGGWVEYARFMQDAGADALELNVYYVAADPFQSGSDVEAMYLELVREVRKAITIPVAVKLGHHFTAFAHLARAMSGAGANGLVLFNRFYQPDFDLERLEVVSNLDLSSPNELRLRLRWIAMLYGRIGADLAVTGGVHSAVDVVKCMMAGANVAMMTSAILNHGIDHIGDTLHDLTRWMEEREYDSVDAMRGSMSRRSVAEPAAFERANYMKVLRSYRATVP